MFKSALVSTILFVLTCASSFAATPITHVYMAERWMQYVESFEGDKRAAFILGNLFPDIQYLGDVSRTDTHEANPLIETVYKTEEPFRKGACLHAFVDKMREALVVEWQIYSHVSEYASGHQMATLLKLVEDEILYQPAAAADAAQIVKNIIPEEIATEISKKTLKKWHYFLSVYFSMPPSQLLELMSEQNLPLLNIPPETIKLWSQIVPKLAQKPELIDYVRRLDDAFTETFRSFKTLQRLSTMLPI